MAAIDAASALAPRDGLYGRDVDGDLIILDETSGDLHTLNASAALVWRCFDGVASLQEIAGDIAAVVGAPAEQVLDDVVEMARELESQGLLTASPADDAPVAAQDAAPRHADAPEPNT